MIFYGGGGWKYWLAGLAVSVGIFAVLYFTVIKPTTDTANNAIRTSLEQSQRQLNQAEKLTGCLQDAGTDIGKVQDCQAKFGP
jgi:hypothetical protein